ncbi:sigma-70 family RNA polymerase sigma factor [Solirubrobacter phytolaccae]|uniref:Sigma-70 family RNA polymerase sigma factor n=1 Tax=Solirubrobacter phytolaccae TaxID=1404360 RepID=A0A9X3N6V8_9ACTN|nr:sigma-70 family RNA polymerase sigma factor [Solirubrobacter phytolaccae]MDA0178826.1 sigma-70 family RNA polymerase sigma factor [Solirubrobacter phytolaccae]
MDERELAARRALTVALRTAAAILGSREEAADVAQDVAIDVLRSLHKLREPAAFDAWVHRMTVRRTLRALRKRRAGDVPFALALELPADTPDHDQVLATRAVLAHAMKTLPPRQRVALALRYVHDLDDEQIAAALGCRVGTVHALLSRARATLRDEPRLQELTR